MTLKEWKDKKKIITMVSIVFIFIVMMKKKKQSIVTYGNAWSALKILL
jgi:hypothetical protein